MKSTRLFLFQQKKKLEKLINIIIISYDIKFIDSARFMASELLNLGDNLAELNHKINSKDCDCFLEYESVVNNSIKYE